MTKEFWRRLVVVTATAVAGVGFQGAAEAQTLYETLSSLVKSHTRLRAAGADVAAARENARVALGSYFPTMDLTAHYGFEEQRKGQGTDDTHLPTREFDLKVTQLLWDFGSTGATVAQSDLALSQTEVIQEATRQGLLLEAVSAHLGLISAHEIANFAKGSEANIKRQTELEDARVKRGSGFSTDVLQAKAQLAGAHARRVQAEGALELARYRYNAVFGVPPEDPGKLKRPVLPLDLLPVELEDAVDRALKNNLQIYATRISTEIARSATRKARADGFLPVLNVIAENKLKEDVGGTVGFKGEQIIRVEATYSFNLGGTSFNSLEASKQAFLASESRLADARNAIAEQARNAWQQLRTSKVNAQFLRNQANIASEFLELARKERRLGRRSLIDVLAGETALINASSDAAAAENNISVAGYTLLSVTGQLTLDAFK